ncbi:MAG: UDP-N-acetylmuramoyl-tripeptide--D-alanyl-D-alanine ligase [Thermodesulfovibrionaceae bacterium]
MFTLDDLLRATEGSILSKADEVFSSASIDTRTVKESEIFFALKGSKRDGHDFLEEALKKSKGAVISKDIELNSKDKTVVKVKDTLKALQDLARYLREQFKGVVIGVVGSNGKTTTKELISQILSQRYEVLKTEENLNNHIGVPLCVSRLNKNTEVMVLELGTNKPGDIKELCGIVKPHYAVITNIGYEHLEGFGSLEGVRAAEFEILPFVKKIFVNGDDDFLMEGLKEWRGEIITFGLKPHCEFRAENIELKDYEISFDVVHDYLNFSVKVPLFGIYNVYNTLAAISVGLSLVVSKCGILRALESFTPVKMRGEIFRINGLEIVFDAYNANPSSMKVALEELSRRKKNRQTVAILGDMLELGSITEKAHEELGKLMKDLNIDLFIGVGKFINNALKYKEGYVFDSCEQAAQFLKNIIKGTEVILIKGSRGMRMEKILDFLKEKNNAL